MDPIGGSPPLDARCDFLPIRFQTNCMFPVIGGGDDLLGAG
jgi:hypothetical protein